MIQKNYQSRNEDQHEALETSSVSRTAKKKKIEIGAKGIENAKATEDQETSNVSSNDL